MTGEMGGGSAGGRRTPPSLVPLFHDLNSGQVGGLSTHYSVTHFARNFTSYQRVVWLRVAERGWEWPTSARHSLFGFDGSVRLVVSRQVDRGHALLAPVSRNSQCGVFWCGRNTPDERRRFQRRYRGGGVGCLLAERV